MGRAGLVGVSEVRATGSFVPLTAAYTWIHPKPPRLRSHANGRNPWNAREGVEFRRAPYPSPCDSLSPDLVAA